MSRINQKITLFPMKKHFAKNRLIQNSFTKNKLENIKMKCEFFLEEDNAQQVFKKV